ncbi:hypothetical protein SORBI_3005G088600 [Sorghum bicolor]|uniref:Transmembrane protein n=1 Tax=Sorghum bicolor TaxID=4558 RepID=A0A1B6PR35_SORBI|nr:hypothetical protein SORBI_3005G088600 [Sorghum bicolor]OQU83176.1 hypothetical protein SORBI_3005G088600 [Sorghum bicolor]
MRRFWPFRRLPVALIFTSVRLPFDFLFIYVLRRSSFYPLLRSLPCSTASLASFSSTPLFVATFIARCRLHPCFPQYARHSPLPKLPPRDCDAGALLFWASARLLLYFSCRVPGRVKLIVPCTAARVLRFIASS